MFVSRIEGLLFHSFPVDQHRFELWRQTVLHHCSQTLSINKHSKICYRHFRPDDYIANQTGLTRYLKATAIPSIFAETSPNTIPHPSTTRNNHLLPSSIHLNNSPAMKFNTFSETISASSISIPTITDTKARRLLNTIDKLHQIQNATKVVGIPQKISLDNESIKQDVDEQKHTPESSTLHINPIKDHDPNTSFQISQSFTIDHSTAPKDSQSIRKWSIKYFDHHPFFQKKPFHAQLQNLISIHGMKILSYLNQKMLSKMPYFNFSNKQIFYNIILLSSNKV